MNTIVYTANNTKNTMSIVIFNQINTSYYL